ncbi:magnesium transporter [Mesomycoplasma neurolyticum]|uniref:Magnesium transporter MgtE n=1 Tax=Mesomycoplasma neurolyticum TaxID=2120 RepID=A0A449A532_9BACT|nr:magnesium transporter [Mesomycoplasma neurolyticum]VEU59371.1 Magnesium transporter mgtE [Mesomycoplasma neurolyticum]
MSLLELVKKRDIAAIRKYSNDTIISEIANEVSTLPIAEKIVFFRLLKTEDAGEIFAYLDLEIQEELIQNFSNEMIVNVVSELYTDEIADLIEEIPERLAIKILKNIDKDTRQNVNKILKYDDDQIGSVMSVDLIFLKDHWTNKRALEHIKKYKNELELTHYYYIVDSKWNFKAATTLEDIVFNEPEAKLTDHMFKVPTIYTTSKKSEASLIFADNDLSVLPVVNKSNKIVGMITSDDVIDILQEEATEDIYKMAGINPHHEISYIKTSVLKIVKSRIFWLLILMLGSTLSQIVIEVFTNSIENSSSLKSLGLSVYVSTIVSIIPVIAGSAGNAGSQSATTITRAISLGENSAKKYISQVLVKELTVGLIVGSILMVANFLRLMIYFSISRDLFVASKTSKILIISFTASLALLIVITFSKILGSFIPLIAAKLGKDPAVLSAPILATLTDATSTFIFFGITILVFMLAT